MIGQATGHRRGTGSSPVFGFGEFLMGETEIVRAANQVHPRVQAVQACSSVPTFAGQACQSLSEGCIQAFDKRRIEHASSAGELEQLLCLL